MRKPNGDLRICGDYKVGVNHLICSDSYPILNIENVLHSLAGMKCITKIDIKSTYLIQIDNKFKEITTVNYLFQKAIENVLRRDIKI